MDPKEKRDINHIRWRLTKLPKYTEDPFLIGQINENIDQCDYAIRPDLATGSPKETRGIKHIRLRLSELYQHTGDPFMIGQINEIIDQCDYAIRPGLVQDLHRRRDFAIEGWRDLTMDRISGGGFLTQRSKGRNHGRQNFESSS